MRYFKNSTLLGWSRSATPADGTLIWLTGLPCSGKTTLASALAQRFSASGSRVEILDGDVCRRHLSEELGFSRTDRDANVLRLGYVAGLLVRHGVVVIVAAVSPFRAARDQVRQQHSRFFEVHVDCPVEECERRDVKGMYALARSGQLSSFTGVDDPYEPPPAPDVRVDTLRSSADCCVETIIAALGRAALLRT